MAIDGCEHTFEDLAHRALPTFMVKLRERIADPLPLGKLNIRGVGRATILRELGLDHDPRGCYVLLDAGRPVYVGISKHVVERLLAHVRGADHFTATLAYRIANHEHPHGMTAAEAMRDKSFKSHFEDARKRLLGWHAAFVEIENPLELYVFQAFCAMELDTGFESGGWNTFETH